MRAVSASSRIVILSPTCYIVTRRRITVRLSPRMAVARTSVVEVRGSYQGKTANLNDSDLSAKLEPQT
jgi:hypothetical protein